MFTKLDKTQHPPKDKPLMAWDGNCGFCHYWVIRWKIITGDNVRFQPFQEVYQDFPDIDLKYFRQAIRMIDTDGKIYTGPAAAFRSFQYGNGNKWKWVMPLYNKIGIFRWASDRFYNWISKHRPFMYKVTVFFFGKNPAKPKPYWVYYSAGLAAVLAGIIVLT